MGIKNAGLVFNSLKHFVIWVKNPIVFALYQYLAFLFLILSACSNEPADPRFEPQVIDGQVQIGYGLGIGDVDGDGLQDILLADKKQFVWYRNPDWQRFVMVDSLTERDNVCLAVRDINGDDQVEVAVGAQWNPGETSDESQSGSVHYLIRPDDPTKLWEPVRLHHEPTVHRMHWVKAGNSFQLVVLPLHGRANISGEGPGVKVLAYKIPDDPRASWHTTLLDSSMHLTHNFDVISENGKEALLIGGKEGARIIRYNNGSWDKPEWVIRDFGFGEIRQGDDFITGIQPMHGNTLAVYIDAEERMVLTDSLNQGHALATADLLAKGHDQIVVGWREPNEREQTGVKLFIPDGTGWTRWRSLWIDKNGMACEDLKVADLNGDGKKDIIAAGRSTHNLNIYWNRSEFQ